MAFTGFLIYAALGLIFGSFATALIYRIPREKNWISERSKCPSCKAALGAADLVPVFSWLLSKGKCRHCQSQIPASYPLREFILLVLSLGVYFSYGLSAEGLIFAFVLPFLFSLFFIDLEHKRLPDVLVAIVFIIGLIRVFIGISSTQIDVMVYAIEFLGGALVYSALFWFMGLVVQKVVKKKALGMGDIKFAAAAGIWLGISNLSYFLMLSGLIGVAFGMIWKKIKGEDRFPFGPALILSFYFIMLVG